MRLLFSIIIVFSGYASYSQCSITQFTVNVGSCDNGTNSYQINGSVEFVNPPATGSLIISANTGQGLFDTTLAMPFNSPMIYTLSGLPSDGQSVTLLAEFSAMTACSSTITYTAPDSCICTAELGNYTSAFINNTGTLCVEDSLVLMANNQAMAPYSSAMNTGGVSYNPGIGILMFSCPPSQVAPTLDPCFIGVLGSTMTGDYTFHNDGNLLNSFPQGTFPGDTIYLSGLTLYDTPNYQYNNDCYDHDLIAVIKYDTACVTMINEFKLNVAIYPNPVTSLLNIKVDESCSFFIYDCAGKLHGNGEIMKELSLDVSNYEPGVYLMKIINSHSQKLEKIIIE